MRPALKTWLGILILFLIYPCVIGLITQYTIGIFWWGFLRAVLEPTYPLFLVMIIVAIFIAMRNDNNDNNNIAMT
jgi:predicted Na+-dependent transporter